MRSKDKINRVILKILQILLYNLINWPIINHKKKIIIIIIYSVFIMLFKLFQLHLSVCKLVIYLLVFSKQKKKKNGSYVTNMTMFQNTISTLRYLGIFV